MIIYTYTVEGRAAGGQTWQTEGETAHEAGSFPEAVLDAVNASFQQLTQGKAIYGQPGVGCAGPYTITQLTVTRKD